MKKGLLLFLSLGLTISLAACDISKKGKAKEDDDTSFDVKAVDVATMEVEGAEYILPEGEEVSEDEGFLAVTITVKNETGKSFDVATPDFMLYDEDDSKIEAANVYDVKDVFSYEKISSKKSKTGVVVFLVDKDSKYQLHFEPNIYEVDKEAKPVITKIDTADYKDDTQNSLKAATAFVDEVFLGKENKDYDKLVANDKKEAQESFDTNFAKGLKKKFYYYTPTDTELSLLAKSFKETNESSGSVSYELYNFTGETAVVLINVEGISFNDINDTITKFIEDYEESHQELSYSDATKAAEKEVVNQLPKIFQSAEVSSLDEYGDGFKMQLKKDEDGKWAIQTKGSGVYFDNIQQAFRGGLYVS